MRVARTIPKTRLLLITIGISRGRSGVAAGATRNP